MAMIGDDPELAERLLGGLPPKLRRERLVGPLPFGFELRALEIHPGAVAVERLLERGNDDASQAGFETASRLAGRGQPGLRVGPGAQLARHLGEPADRVDHAHPLRDPHLFQLMEPPPLTQARPHLRRCAHRRGSSASERGQFAREHACRTLFR